MSRRQLDNTRALVTGASSGIGRAVALELARAGSDVLLLARSEDKLKALAEEIRTLGRRSLIVAGDATQAAIRQEALRRAESEWGGLDILVNNAGVSAQGAFIDADEGRLRQIFELNFFAAAEFIRAAVPLLTNGSSKAPIIVNMGSVLGHRAIPLSSEYCASKFALRGLSESLRVELASCGVDVLLVSPGSTDTGFFDHLLEKKAEMPWGEPRGVPPEKVARATVRAIRRGKREIVPSLAGRSLLAMCRVSPRLVDWFLRRSL